MRSSQFAGLIVLVPTKKKSLVIAGIFLAAIVLVLVIAPFFINADRFRPQIAEALSEKIGRQVEIGRLHASLLRGSLVAEQISIADDPAYSHQPFLTAKSLTARADLLPMVFSGDLRVHALTFDDPHLQLLRTARGDWNFGSLGATSHGDAKVPAGPFGEAGLNSFSIDRLTIRDGMIAFGRAGQPARLAYEQVNATAENISRTAAFPLRFEAKTPGGGSLRLEAQAGPLGSEVSRTPFDGQFKADGVPAADVQNLLAVLGYALPGGSSFMGGTIKADLALHGPFDRLVASGPVRLQNVRLAGFSLASKLAGTLGGARGATGNDTLIQLASTNLRYAPEGARADEVNIVLPGIGSLTGAGTVSANNRLNFRMVAKIAPGSPLAALTSLPIFSQTGGLPFRIQGSASDPVFVPDIAGLAKTPFGKLPTPQPSGPTGIIPELFKKAKPQP
jgi:hypothetical protein